LGLTLEFLHRGGELVGVRGEQFVLHGVGVGVGQDGPEPQWEDREAEYGRLAGSARSSGSLPEH
jgi:hypothetical protein